jgi:beta-N-acetylhexosaminidase
VRRAVFSIALIAGITSGASGIWAENENIGGDLDWPTTAIIEEPPVQQPKPRAAPAERQQATRQEQQAPEGTTTVPRAPNRAQAARNSAAQQQSPNRGNSEGWSPLRQEARESASRAEEDTPQPPVPDRRAAALPAPVPVVPIKLQTEPATQQAASVGAQAEPVKPQAVPVKLQTIPLPLNLAATLPAPEPDDGLGKLIGQMLIIGFQGVAPDESWPHRVAAQIESGKIGGVLVMSHNMLAPDQLRKLTGAFRRTKAQIAPFIAVDQEGGLVQRLPAEKGFQQYSSAAELGMSNDPLNAYNLYQRMALELAIYGFNVNLGPVVDLQLSGENGAAAKNERRYGSQPKHVAAFAKAFRMAHQGEGLLTVLKHFPGPMAAPGGGAETQWDAAALEPYRQLITGGNTDMVMVGHLAHAEFSDEPGLPASLSKKAIQTRLRDEIGFKGVIISDDLEARAVATRFPLEESVVRAISAGNDLLLIGNQDNPSPDLPDKVAAIIKQAVTSGVLTREQLQASYDRIIAAKQSVSTAAREIASAKETDADEEKPAAR